MRTIRRDIDVDCPFSAAIELAEGCLSRISQIRVALGRTSALLRRGHAKTYTLRDRTDDARRHTALSVELVPRGGWMPFPTFDILLTARPRHRGSLLHIEATYDPPMGAVGRVADAVGGRHVAEHVIEAFSRDLRAALERAWQAERETGSRHSSSQPH